MSQLQNHFESLNLQNQVELIEKKTQLEEKMNKLQIQPQLENFTKEALDVNAKLKRQKEVFFQQASITGSYCDSN